MKEGKCFATIALKGSMGRSRPCRFASGARQDDLEGKWVLREIVQTANQEDHRLLWGLQNVYLV